MTTTDHESTPMKSPKPFLREQELIEYLHNLPTGTVLDAPKLVYFGVLPQFW